MGDVEKLEKYLAELFEQRGYPGMAVCIRGPEGIVFEKGFGWRSIEHKKGVNGDTVFGIASMSKSMTALACCILQAEGKMSLDDPVVNYFPNFHIPGTADECVTIKMLAMHRTGPAYGAARMVHCKKQRRAGQRVVSGDAADGPEPNG